MSAAKPPRPPGEPVLLQARQRLRGIVAAAGLAELEVAVSARPLTAGEAIGSPARDDYPIVRGRERVIEARVGGARGQAFTDAPGDYRGTLAEVLDLPLDDNRRRAVLVATINATLRHLDRVRGTVHCRDEDPEVCAGRIAEQLRQEPGDAAVGLIGLNPAIAERLVRAFGAGNVRVTDLDPERIGRSQFGVEIWDGRTATARLVAESGIVLVTGTTIVGGTFDGILRLIESHGRPYLLYGVTAAGVAELLGLPRICPCGRDG